MLLNADRLVLTLKAGIVRLIMVVFDEEAGGDLAKVDADHLLAREKHKVLVTECADEISSLDGLS